MVLKNRVKGKCLFILHLQQFTYLYLMYNLLETYMKLQKMKFHNLRALLPTEESKINLSIAIGVPVKQINDWLDPNNNSVPYADSLIKMMKYFDCSCDYLLDFSNIKDRPDDVKRLLEELHKNDV